MQQKYGPIIDILSSFLVRAYFVYISFVDSKSWRVIKAVFFIACAVLVLYVAQTILFWRVNYVTLPVPSFISEDGVYEFSIDINPDEIPDKHGRIFEDDLSKVVKLQPKQNITNVLNNLNVIKKDQELFLAKLSKVFPSSSFRVGQSLTFDYNCVVTYYTPKVEAEIDRDSAFLPVKKSQHRECNIVRFMTTTPQDKRAIVESDEHGGFTARLVGIKTKTKITSARGVVKTNLLKDAVKAGAPSSLVSSAIKEYSFNMNMRRDVRVGDKFTFVFEEILDESGAKLRNGKLLYSDLVLRGNSNPMYVFDGYFYNKNGEGARKPLLKKPIDKSRISSSFGARKHPVLGVAKFHFGIDYAAPYGTPIYAAGDGTITFVGKKSGYGNFIEIRHNKEFTTRYGHMRGFKAGLKNGMRVSQRELIGYVGSTGMATGPHLHYEIVKSGVRVDPARQVFTFGKKLVDGELARFKRFVNRVQQSQSGSLNMGSSSGSKSTPKASQVRPKQKPKLNTSSN